MWPLWFQFSLHLATEKLDLWFGLWLGGGGRGKVFGSDPCWGGSPGPAEVPATLMGT